MSELISVQEADKLLRTNVSLTPSVRCPLGKAAGRVLREDILADRDLPPFDRCMLDGYALRASEAKPGATFKVHARVHAGEPTQPLPDEPFAAIEVMTGSVLPPGADAVVGYEDTEALADGSFRYHTEEPLSAGDAVHRQGSDYPKDSPLLKAGAVLGPVEAGIVASCGYAEPLYSQQPRIAIFGTGDELVPVETKPEPHQLRESNLHAIENALAGAGFSAGLVTRLGDDVKSEKEKLVQALEANDVIVISGAVSKGRRDWIPSALDALSSKVFHGVAQRPGKPMGFWKKENGPAIFGLPGNPVSTLVATHRYVLPYLRACTGMAANRPRMVELAAPFSFPRNMTLFLPFSFDEEGRAQPRPLNNSGDYARLAGTAGFLELAADESDWTQGCLLPYTLWQQ